MNYWIKIRASVPAKAEMVRFQRALEGEIAQTIMAIQSIKTARVLLAIPVQSEFVRDRKKPSASVVVNLYQGRSLDKGQIESIIHLVASSVPQLEAEQVTVVDQKGQLLNGKDSSSLSYLTDGEHLDAYRDRTREVVLAHLDGTSLRALHTTLAAALAADHFGDHGLLSRLYRGAGDLPRARHHADLAARAAVDARDFDRAAAVLLRTAEWSPADASSLHAQRAAALARAGRSRAAADAYLAARTGADPEVRLQLCADAALHLLTSGHLQAGRKALAEGFAGAALAIPASSVGGRLAALWRRGRMAVRGLHWDERPAHLLPRGALARIDLLRAAAVGALLIDPAGAADIQAQHLLLSLQTGEPRCIGRANAVEAALAAELDAGGVRAHAPLTAARELVDRLGDRETVELVEFIELRDATLRGDFAATLARADLGGGSSNHTYRPPHSK